MNLPYIDEINITFVAGTDIYFAALTSVQVADITNKKVNFSFNGVSLSAQPGSVQTDVINDYYEKLSTKAEKAPVEEATKSPAPQPEEPTRDPKEALEEALADAPAEMATVHREVERSLRELNEKSAYGARILEYASNWARLMEIGIRKTGTLSPEEVRRAERLADYDGINGNMCRTAKNYLIRFWRFHALLCTALNEKRPDYSEDSEYEVEVTRSHTERVRAESMSHAAKQVAGSNQNAHLASVTRLSDAKENSSRCEQVMGQCVVCHEYLFGFDTYRVVDSKDTDCLACETCYEEIQND